jgi:uncharacterized delta-60 repeat protein
LTPHVGAKGFGVLLNLFFPSLLKRRSLSTLMTALTLISLYGCAKKDDPAPDPKKEEPDPGTNPGTNNLVDYDPTFPLYEGKANFSAMLPDGKVVIWGSSEKTAEQVFRVTKDGQHDADFDTGKDKSWFIRKANDIAVQKDGKVILAGEFLVNGKTCSIIRLTSSGVLDNSFTPYDVTKLTSYTITISNLLVLADGKIVFSQSMFNSSLSLRYNGIFGLNANGTVAFSVEGAWIRRVNDDTHIIGSNEINDIIQLSNGKLMVCGGVKFFNKRRYVARINSDGSLDESFDFKESINGGVGDPLCLAEQNGKILVGGSFNALVSESQRDTQYPFLNLMRLNADGSIDQTLGVNTITNHPIGIIVRDDNSFVTLSNAFSNGDNTHISLYNSNGVPKASYNIADSKSALKNLFRQSNDKLLVTGNILNSSHSYAIARLNVK